MDPIAPANENQSQRGGCMVQQHIIDTVGNALKEDVGTGDLTAHLIPEKQVAQGHIFAREFAVLCGVSWVDEVYKQLSTEVTITWHFKDGDTLRKGDKLCDIQGPTRALLTGERVALNFLQTLSGTATQVGEYVASIEGHKAQLLDTRKTIPGLRLAQKYAVQCGGGHNHRIGLFDAMLVKDNHIVAAGSIGEAVNVAREKHPQVMLEIEVENLEELQVAIDAKVDRILCDNFPLDMLRQGVAMAQGKVPLEASGGITLHNIGEVAATGVDFISVGALTKDIKAVDLTMTLTGSV